MNNNLFSLELNLHLTQINRVNYVSESIFDSPGCTKVINLTVYKYFTKRQTS